MPDVTLTIDGVQVTVPAGTNIVDAARQAGIAIPVFCYHPRLKPVGMCRMCLVEVGTPKIDPATRQPVLDAHGQPVIAMMPKLQTACTTPVSPGMVVKTTTEQVKFAQRGILEFLLTSHPLDCPVCDKGGECPLQNLTMGWGPAVSRFDYNDKVHFEKPVKLGDLIYLDRERCILCGRCVRFQDEIADDPVLGFDNRGRNWMIISKSDPPFNSKFSGNTTDICPVGALTSSDFRFKARVWELQSKPVVCTLCPVGCNLTLDMRYDRLMRVMPRENAAVNDIWICDKGRYGHRFIETDRLTTPLVRRDGKLVPVSWDEALEVVADQLTIIRARHGGSALAGLAGPQLSNEDLYLFQKLLRELGSENIDTGIGGPAALPPDEIGGWLAPGPGTDLSKLGAGTVALVVGADPEEEAPLYLLRLRGIAQRGGKLIVAGLRPTKLDRSATKVVRYQPAGELAFVHGLLKAALEAGAKPAALDRVQGWNDLRRALGQTKLEDLAAACGLPVAELETLAKDFLAAEQSLIVYGWEARSAGPALAEALAALMLLSGRAGTANNGIIALLPGGNSRGAIEMGVRPDAGPGYAPRKQRGLDANGIWEAAQAGKVRAIWLAGVDPAAKLPAARAALAAAEFVVVQDLFLTASAELADVVLPAASVAEREGTYTNAERRVQRSRQACAPVGEARPDWQIIAAVAQTLAMVPIGGGRNGPIPVTSEAWEYVVAADVAAEIAAKAPGYAGITYAALAATGTGGNWGRQYDDAIYYDGTSYANSEGVGLVLPALATKGAALTFTGAVTRFADDRPLLLLEQVLAYDGDRHLRGSKLQGLVPAGHVVISADDAAKLNIHSGDRVRLTSATGELVLPARVVADLPSGIILLPAGLADVEAAAIETGPRTRVSLAKVVMG
ncbi:NADH-quinone oxidoreductase subunit NuoG [Chloroflexus sp.]|uniref:NADH-quinone oxidoreductase subunit NuoG n=1 Tax=Chloroflexus sp. TaxID=1904827 RepID=UPI00298EE539|nr:NADH-quinone oxidoreductase subunit NuoG [Chloroflexus sp.]MDW8403185.1 NADH-quinone oxidoreductase subunit NuoG [Chloroflexus sp.]